MAESVGEEATNQTKETDYPVRFRIPAKLPSVVAQHLTVQPNEDGVLLSFYEIIPPLMPPEPSEEQMKQMKEVGVIAECVSKVFVPNSRYVDFINAMDSVLPDDDEEEESEVIEVEPIEVEQGK